VQTDIYPSSLALSPRATAFQRSLRALRLSASPLVTSPARSFCGWLASDRARLAGRVLPVPELLAASPVVRPAAAARA